MNWIVVFLLAYAAYLLVLMNINLHLFADGTGTSLTNIDNILKKQPRSKDEGAWSRRLILTLVVILAPLLLLLLGVLVVAVRYLLSS